MEMNIKVNISMVFQKIMGIISGGMEQSIRVISNRDIVMDMAFGQILSIFRNIKGTFY